MTHIVRNTIKKYILYVCIVFFVLTGGHLMYLYSYSDAESIPEEGGTISEAIIGTFPHLNPLLPSSDHNGYINNLLYRSILEYSTETESFTSDLMSCNLDDLIRIECTLENNLKWSDGSDITTNDIVTTLNVIERTRVNPIIASLVRDTTITSDEERIIFTNTSRDINFLNVFDQAILPASIVETLNEENIEQAFSGTEGIYSGRFMVSNISQDETVGITKITLGKNPEYFQNPLLIDFLILNIFRDEAHFLKNRNSFNIFNDTVNLIGESIPRLESYPYTLSQFVGVFFNSETITRNGRKFLDSTINRDTYIETIGENNIQTVVNPFLSDESIDTTTNQTIDTLFNRETYYRKSELLEIANNRLIRENEEEIEAVEQELISEETSVEEEVDTRPTQETLSYVDNPTTSKYNFVSEDDILVSGRVDSGVEAVYINDYRLTGFDSGDDVFYYRLSESFETIQEGENSYTLYFESNGERREIETFVYIYNTDSEALSEIEANFFASEESEDISDSQEDDSEEVEDTSSSNSESITTELSISEIETLSDTLYYTIEGEALSLDVLFVQSDQYLQQASEVLRDQLTNAGIQANIIPIDIGDITTGLRSDELEYDIVLIGINLGYFSSNIFPYFHSSQIQNGYNISNFKQLSFDILLEELKANNLSEAKRGELEAGILDIIAEETLMKTIYTPKLSLLVDRNIKNFSIPESIPDDKYRSSALLDSYLREERIRSNTEKSFVGFVGYTFSELFLR